MNNPRGLPFNRRESLTPASEKPHLNPTTASPPPPLRMERGVDSIICIRRRRYK
ncbi:hypothetical protein HMPREF0973_01140 [Prevotella veroralis F0319]|uniref:Uncharacterized protein n=1 Tax=Prevotella veroralis F0319 TaxID=649761 RepID=C9MNF3_9BACT|nr:hypothetical protein HMPREF0973_01140 [Prevotella veroralis F0319]